MGEEGTSPTDKGEKVTLQFYMLGDAPKDLPVIESEINKLAEADLNVNVKFNYTSWTDWDQKYKLLLSSGQPIDLIFTADWTFYQSYAKKEHSCRSTNCCRRLHQHCNPTYPMTCGTLLKSMKNLYRTFDLDRICDRRNCLP